MTTRPNVLLITADQWRGECLSTLGHLMVRTPTLDALAAEGVLFRYHYAQCAPCGPSRASLLTGMYAMNHRSLRNGTPLDARFTNIALEMRRLGSTSASCNRIRRSLPPSRTTRCTTRTKSRRLGAAQTPRRNARSTPNVGYYRRHFREREGHDFTNAAEDERARRQLGATCYGMMTEVDDSLGRLFAARKTAGCYEDRLIVFTSDHAEMLWDHWVLGKEAFFDGAFHVPLIIRAPGNEGARASVIESFTGHVDILPTILEHLGAVPPLQCDGRPLTPFLLGDTRRDWPREVFWELDFRNAGSDRPERARRPFGRLHDRRDPRQTVQISAQLFGQQPGLRA